jgi:hypothetical protein
LKEQILTAYGLVELEVRSLEGSRIYVARERHVFPAGAKTHGGKTLKAPFVIPRGAVLVPAWDDFEGKNPERFHRVFAGGIYEALRSTLHALWGYGLRKRRGELQLLLDISTRLAEDLSVLMEGNAAPSNKLAEVQSDLTKIAEELGRPIDRAKAEAAKKAAEAATLEVEHPSGTRSKNIPANEKRVEAIRRRIDKRRDRVCHIGPRVNFYENILAQAVGHLFDDLGSLRQMLEGERPQIARALSPEVQRIFCRRADLILERTLPRLDAAPFLKTAQMIRYDLGLVRKAKSKKFALAAIDRILTAIRLKETQRSIEARVILPLALCGDLDPLAYAITVEIALRRLSDIMARFDREINDEGFVRPVKPQVMEVYRSIIAKTDPSGAKKFDEGVDATEIKEQMKVISRML